MASTDRHGFLLWAAGFTQSDIILNDLLLKLEVKLDASAVSRTETAPVGGDADGDMYIMPGGTLTGAFSTFSEHDVAILRNGTWYAFTPISGWPAWVEDDAEGVMFNGTSWIVVSKDLPKDKLDATADPTVDNDVDEEYSVGSHWYNVTDDKAFVCLDATDGAAVWKETTLAPSAGLVNNFTATTDPGVTNDVDEGYTVGSRWVNTSTGSVFTCVDNTDGAAVWVSASGLNQSQVDARVVAVAPEAVSSRTYTVTLADDAASFFDFSAVSSAIGFISITDNFSNTHRGHFSFRVHASTVFIGTFETAGIVPTTGALTGTSGADGGVNISAHTDRKLYIENRVGATRTFIVSIETNANW